MDDRAKVMTAGPWKIMDHYLTVQRWQPYFRLSNVTVGATAIWIQLLELPLEYFNGEVLMEIGKLIGKPLKLDSNTVLVTQGKFARRSESCPSKPLVDVTSGNSNEEETRVVKLLQMDEMVDLDDPRMVEGTDSFMKHDERVTSELVSHACKGKEDLAGEKIRGNSNHLATQVVGQTSKSAEGSRGVKPKKAHEGDRHPSLQPGSSMSLVQVTTSSVILSIYVMEEDMGVSTIPMDSDERAVDILVKQGSNEDIVID
ncbi:hypothetical protein REPUB_Repub05bG0143000 [Reevesia pubescens]